MLVVLVRLPVLLLLLVVVLVEPERVVRHLRLVLGLVQMLGRLPLELDYLLMVGL